MDRYTAYLVDDEILSLKALSKKLEGFPEIEVIGKSTRMEDAIENIEALEPDILFLDIRLMEGTGFDLLNKVNYSGNVLFVTAYDEYALRAFEINALDYILKPVSHERLKKAIDRVRNKTTVRPKNDFTYNTTDRILVIDRSKMVFVSVSSIELISAARDYSMIITSDGGSYLMLRSMKEWEDKLPADQFVRIHRSHIVNINNIKNINRISTSSALIYLKSQDEPITLSRTYYKNAKVKYK